MARVQRHAPTRCRLLLSGLTRHAVQTDEGQGPVLLGNTQPMSNGSTKNVVLLRSIDEEEEQESLCSQLKTKKNSKVLVFLGFLLFGTTTVLSSFLAHPFLIRLVKDVWQLEPLDGDTGGFETNVFSLLSILYAILFGNTFTFLYNRQERLVQELYEEVLCSEVLLEETFLAVHDSVERRQVVRVMREYVLHELYTPMDMNSPFMEGSPFLKLLKTIRALKHKHPEAVDIRGLLVACNRLAEAQSRRSAAACQVLPAFHWVFLYLIVGSLITIFLVFEAASGSYTSRRLIFSALCGLLLITSAVLEDLASPLSGLYTFRDQLDNRLSHLCEAVDRCLARESTFFDDIDEGVATDEDMNGMSLVLGGDPGSISKDRRRRQQLTKRNRSSL